MGASLGFHMRFFEAVSDALYTRVLNLLHALVGRNIFIRFTMEQIAMVKSRFLHNHFPFCREVLNDR
jgi:hypothetical protein